MHEASSTYVPIVRDRPAREALRARKVDLDATISEIRATLQPLLDEQDILDRQLAYPVDTLPNEIISEIFLSFIPPYPEAPPFEGPLSPVALGQICRKWREIAFSTPSLWRAMNLTLVYEEDFPALMDILSTWLSRSRMCPLSITLIGPWYGSGFSVPEDGLASFVCAILPHRERWDALELYLPIPCLRLFSGPMPMLDRLTVGPTEYPEESSPGVTVDGPISPFDGAPNLRHVRLTDGCSPAFITLPWSQLTSITTSTLYEFEAYRILKNASALLSFKTILDPEPSLVALALDEEVPPLLYLKVLVLEGEGDPNSEHSRMLQKLTLPALTFLQINERWLDHNSGDPCDILLAFITKSQCTLESLHVKEARRFVELRYRSTFSSVKDVQVEEIEA
ncbi:hypothetical protein FB451DRAFT_1563663 [Mycena latifolia]|nr:hypothetical protein FB451DRAFT_1563663 [Mycena latifolia]